MKVMSNPIPTLVQTIEAYDPERVTAEINRFRKMPSLAEAIKTAAESRKANGHPYEHQQKNCNFWPDAISEATTILLKAHQEFEACSDFDEVHELVKRLLSGVKFIGPMYCYDVAVRIGAFLGHLPDRVYLHAGTLQGAKRLGLPTKKAFLEMSELRKPLQGCSPWEVEDILCHLNKCCRKRDRDTAQTRVF